MDSRLKSYHAYVYSILQKYDLAIHIQIYWTILNEKSRITFFYFCFIQPLAAILYLFKLKLYSFEDIFKKCGVEILYLKKTTEEKHSLLCYLIFFKIEVMSIF